MEALNIPFSYNWNNKLECNAFTTIRLYQPEKHKVDMPVDCVLKGALKCKGKIKKVKVFLLHEMTDYMAWLDTGYDKEEATKIIQRMYSAVDFKTKQLAFILIVKDKK